MSDFVKELNFDGDNKWIKGREKKMGHCSYRVNHAECRRTDARAFVFSRE